MTAPMLRPHRGPTAGLDLDLLWPLDALRRGNILAPAAVAAAWRFGGTPAAAAAYLIVAVAMVEGRPE